MARPHKYDYGPKPFKWPEGKTIERPPDKVYNRLPPQKKKEVDIMSSDANREHAADVLMAICEDLRMPKVNSDRELIDRSIEYFEKSSERKILPTVEGLMLYCGYDKDTVTKMIAGLFELPHDVPGDTTSSIAKKLRTALATYDGTLAMDGTVNTVAYIFRAKNYYEMTNEDKVTISTPQDQQFLTNEEIARRLPVETFDAIDADYDII